MISKVNSAVIKGIEAVPVTIETDIASGLPRLAITGLPDATVKESAVRIKAALINSGFTFPRGRISINIAPAGIRKTGSALDLAIAVGILASSGQVLASKLEQYLFAGEISMDGTLCSTPGVLNIAEEASKRGLSLFIPEQNRSEAAMIRGTVIYPVTGIAELADHLNMAGIIRPFTGSAEASQRDTDRGLDFADVKGQEAAKRALVIAASGGHGILMVGGPSSGKTMLAERMPGIMPPLTHEETVKITEVYSAAGLLDMDTPYITERPFRRPHHTVTRAGLIGGGIVPRPGEITLASGGILFLDEFAEMDPGVADALREPLERKKVVLIRNGETYTFPADFMLVAASNPCRCGYYGDPSHECTCTPGEVMRYRMKLSGPVLDRIDMHLELKGVAFSDLERGDGLSTDEMREMVMRAREIQKKRFAGLEISLNSEMTDSTIQEMVKINYEGKELLRHAYDQLDLNPRTLNRTIKIARTIADINGQACCGIDEVSEALQYSRYGAAKQSEAMN